MKEYFTQTQEIIFRDLAREFGSGLKDNIHLYIQKIV